MQYVKEFNPISERISTIRLNTNPINLFIINVHAPTECQEDTCIEKDILYEEITKVFDESPKNTIKVVIGDCNAKIGKETMFAPTIGLQSLHERSNNNGQRLITFASSRNMTISSTTFSQKDIHQCTWKSPNGHTYNQIDHVLIDRRFRSSILDVTSYRGADCDTDYFLAIAKCKIKIKKICTNNNKMMKFNITKLMYEEENQKYIHEIEELKAKQAVEENKEHMWKTTKETIIAAAKKTLGESRHKSKSWYNDKCRNAIIKRKESKRDYLDNQTTHHKEVFEAEHRE